MSAASSDDETALEADLPEGESIRVGALFNSFGQGANLVGGILLGVIVGRALGPEGKGLVTAVRQLSAMVLDLGGLGIVRAGWFFLGKRRHSVATAVGTYFPLYFCGIGVAVAAIAALMLSGWEPMQRMLVGGDLSAGGAAVIFLLLSLTTAGFFMARGILQGIAHFRTMTVAQLCLTAAQVLPLLALWQLGLLSVARALWLLVAAQALGLLVALWFVRKQLRGRPHSSRVTAREALRYGMPLWLVDVIGFVLVRLDLLIVGGVLGAAELGPYSVAFSLAQMLWFAPEVVWMSAFRAITGAHHESGLELTRRVTHASILISLAAGLSLALLAQPFVSILYGPEFLRAVPLFLVLLPGYFVQASLGQYAMYMLGSLGRPGLDSAVVGASAALKLFLTWVALVPLDWGVTGVAIACSAAFALEGFARLLVVRALTGRSLTWLCVPTPETTRELVGAGISVLRRALARVSRARG